MIEVDDPLKTGTQVSEQLGLPFAWPLTEKDEYTSIGINFGDINIEFINFRIRFGVKGTNYRGFSGVAFKAVNSLEDSLERLTSSGLNYRIGEECEAHTTVTVEDDQVFPTVFLVKYHFDTSGWAQRLKQEFASCAGGKFHIGKFKSLSLNSRIPANLISGFSIGCGDKHQVIFESVNGEGTVISDLIESLEIVILPVKESL
ncbi:hypothetical Protein YC6258_01306 [Gynuella sunshinyii YC6258]|uniref:Uncharacterized protein n=2 Tax=Gynuella sunshinyii TaxID=1445505 RepID=A0A0C5VSS1_9GAMM|nr:hypothetical Protein YC6258_01306 [Gynuella sunshinyii YC6258]